MDIVVKDTRQLQMIDMKRIVDAGSDFHGRGLSQTFSFLLASHKGERGAVCYDDADHRVVQQEPGVDLQLLIGAEKTLKAPMDPGLQLHVRAFFQTIHMFTFTGLGLKGLDHNGSHAGYKSWTV